MEGWSPVKSENIAVFIPAYVQIIESALYEEEDVTNLGQTFLTFLPAS